MIFLAGTRHCGVTAKNGLATAPAHNSGCFWVALVTIWEVSYCFGLSILWEELLAFTANKATDVISALVEKNGPVLVPECSAAGTARQSVGGVVRENCHLQFSLTTVLMTSHKLKFSVKTLKSTGAREMTLGTFEGTPLSVELLGYSIRISPEAGAESPKATGTAKQHRRLWQAMALLVHMVTSRAPTWRKILGGQFDLGVRQGESLISNSYGCFSWRRLLILPRQGAACPSERQTRNSQAVWLSWCPERQ